MVKPNRKPTIPSRRRTSKPQLGALLSALKSGGYVRARKVRLLRAAVRSHRYENALKLEIAADRLISDLQQSEFRGV